MSYEKKQWIKVSKTLKTIDLKLQELKTMQLMYNFTMIAKDTKKVIAINYAKTHKQVGRLLKKLDKI